MASALKDLEQEMMRETKLSLSPYKAERNLHVPGGVEGGNHVGGSKV